MGKEKKTENTKKAKEVEKELPEKTKKSKNKGFFIFFVLIWGSIIAWNIVTPNQEFSEAENRNLAKFPKYDTAVLLDGDYMDDVSTYLNDHFAGRPYWVSGQSLVEYMIGKRELSDIFIGDNALLADNAKADEAITAANIEGINSFVQTYQIPTYTLLVPSSTSVQPQNLPTFAEGWDEVKFIQNTYQAFDEKVQTVDAYATLQEHSEEYIYYRTDHHWTTYGANLAYQNLAQSLGLPNRTEQMEKRVLSESFEGTYQSKTGFPLIEADTMEGYQVGEVKSFDVFDGMETKLYDSIYFPEYLEKKDKYSYFLGQVQPYVTIHTNANTGKKLLIFKDSYAHCLVPMLLEDYDEIRLVDLRYLNGTGIGDIVEAENYDTALFLYSTDVFSQQNVSGKLK